MLSITRRRQRTCGTPRTASSSQRSNHIIQLGDWLDLHARPTKPGKEPSRCGSGRVRRSARTVKQAAALLGHHRDDESTTRDVRSLPA